MLAASRDPLPAPGNSGHHSSSCRAKNAEVAEATLRARQRCCLVSPSAPGAPRHWLHCSLQDPLPSSRRLKCCSEKGRCESSSLGHWSMVQQQLSLHLPDSWRSYRASGCRWRSAASSRGWWPGSAHRALSCSRLSRSHGPCTWVPPTRPGSCGTRARCPRPCGPGWPGFWHWSPRARSLCTRASCPSCHLCACWLCRSLHRAAPADKGLCRSWSPCGPVLVLIRQKLRRSFGSWHPWRVGHDTPGD